MKVGIVELVVFLLASYRATRLVTEDVFPPLRWLRDHTWEKLPEGHFVKELLSCVWCASIWISAGMLVVFYVWPPILWLYAILALSAAAGLLSAWEESK